MLLRLVMKGTLVSLLVACGCGGHTQKPPPKNYAYENKTFFGPRGEPHIRQVVEEYLPEVNDCFVSNNAKGGTRVVVKFLINQLGNVRQAKVVGQTVKNEELSRCVVDTVYTWRFAPSPDFSRTDVTYAFLYSKRDGVAGVTSITK